MVTIAALLVSKAACNGYADAYDNEQALMAYLAEAISLCCYSHLPSDACFLAKKRAAELLRRLVYAEDLDAVARVHFDHIVIFTECTPHSADAWSILSPPSD